MPPSKLFLTGIAVGTDEVPADLGNVVVTARAPVKATRLRVMVNFMMAVSIAANVVLVCF